jgi:hypothetical protein
MVDTPPPSTTGQGTGSDAPSQSVGPLPPNPDPFPTAPPPEAPNPVGLPFNTTSKLGVEAAGGLIGVTGRFSPPSGGVGQFQGRSHHQPCP